MLETLRHGYGLLVGTSIFSLDTLSKVFCIFARENNCEKRDDKKNYASYDHILVSYSHIY